MEVYTEVEEIQRNKMIYQQQLFQQSNLSSQQVSLMQGQVQARPVYHTGHNVNNTETYPPIRMVGPRMPQYTSGYIGGGAYNQAQPTEVTSGYHTYSVSPQQPYLQNGAVPPFPYQQVSGYQPTSAQARSSQYTPQASAFVLGVPGTYTTSSVPLAAPVYANQNQPIQSHSRPQHVYSHNQNHHTPQMMHPQSQQLETQVPAKKLTTAIKLTDPNTGKDLTSEVFKKKLPANRTPPKSKEEEEKARMCALFAAQVAEKIAGTSASPSEPVTMKPPPSEDKELPDNDIDDVSSRDILIKEDHGKVDPAKSMEKDQEGSIFQPKFKESKLGVDDDEGVVVHVKLDEEINNIVADPLEEDQNEVPLAAAVEVPIGADSSSDFVVNEVDLKVEEKELKTETEILNDRTSTINDKKLLDREKIDVVDSLETTDKTEEFEEANIIEVEEESVQEACFEEKEPLVMEKVKFPSSIKQEASNAVALAEIIEPCAVILVESSNKKTEKEIDEQQKESPVNDNDFTEERNGLKNLKVSEQIEATEECLKRSIFVENETSIEKHIIETQEGDKEMANKEVLKSKMVESKETITSEESKSEAVLESVDAKSKEEKVKHELLKSTEMVRNKMEESESTEIKDVISSKPVKIEEPKVNSEANRKEKDVRKKPDKKELLSPKDSSKDIEIESNPEIVKKSESVKKSEPIKKSEPMKKSEPVKISEPSCDENSSKNEAKNKTTELPKDVEKSSIKSADTARMVMPPKKAESKKSEPYRKDSADSMINGHDDSVKTVIPVAKKKKNKNRFKDFDSKESGSNMLSAFVDAPVEPALDIPAESVKPVEPVKPKEEPTWEDKEISIEKDNTRRDSEELENIPKRVATKIISSSEDSEKPHQYDREFLLKFQFASICTSKPEGLPDIDIVLDEAHPPTKALNQSQRISTSNDFMPTFMKQTSGGRVSVGSRGNKDRRGGPPSNTPRMPKVIQIPQFEKLELKKTENEWVRPSEKAKVMAEDEKADFELDRNVRSILNKLTPQKFKPLVNQMLSLSINSQKKLENAISLIFEKAISEPGFSVAYANMCRVLTDQFNNVPSTNQPPNGPVATVTFRKILLNKCQREFEKENSDEKKLEIDRGKVFDSEAERKNWLEELDYRELMNRRRTLGNIRFIGELYKLNMISENIMHDCIYKLLKVDKQESGKSDKQDSVEEQLECLCKLLTTIGKDLDHEKAKPRMDQYFGQIHKLIEKRKLSSRIKFALKDVIELRSGGWIPRRDEGNPKTIDQIHKEAQEKEKVNEIARQQDKLQRKLEPKGGRGGRDNRDSHSGRPGGGSSSSSDGWSTIPSKSSRSSTAVDASKFKLIQKNDLTGISLGPGGLRPGTWSKGASGGGSRSGSGSSTPTSEIDQRGSNRFDPLSESSISSGSLDRRGGSRLPMTGKKSSSLSRKDEQNAALRAVRDFTGRNQSPGRSSRNLSPARSSRNNSPAHSRNHSPAPSAAFEGDSLFNNNLSHGETPPVLSTNVTEEKMRKVTKSTINEYLGVNDIAEASLCLKELSSPGLHSYFVEEAFIIVVERKSDDRRKVGSLLLEMMKVNLITVDQMFQGLSRIVSLAPDFAVDIPFIYKYLGEVLGPIVCDGTFPLTKFKAVIEPLVHENKAGIVMAETLSAAVAASGNEDLISSLWLNSKIKWEMLLPKDVCVDQFINDNKMEFTTQFPPSHMSDAHSSLSRAGQIQEEMQRILKHSHQGDNNNELISFIEKKFSKEEIKDALFIEHLTKAVCSSAIIWGKTCECNKDLLGKSKKVLLRYIHSNKTLELHALYALQQLVHELEQPLGLLQTFFKELYDGDIITEDTFFKWENSKEYPAGKGAALSSVKSFMTWLKKADEESNDEESIPILN